uniref:Uncharacterized protein n=1 Tax=Arundo donax TaxID=35708 RepID=A0A0A9HCX0_ARUDO
MSVHKRCSYRVMNMWKFMQSFDQYNVSFHLLQVSSHMF